MLTGTTYVVPEDRRCRSWCDLSLLERSGPRPNRVELAHLVGRESTRRSSRRARRGDRRSRSRYAGHDLLRRSWGYSTWLLDPRASSKLGSRGSSQQVHAPGDREGRAAPVDRELAVQARDVRLHGVLRDEQGGRDVGVRRSPGELVEDVALARAQGRRDRARRQLRPLVRERGRGGEERGDARRARRCRRPPRAPSSTGGSGRAGRAGRRPGCRAGSSRGTGPRCDAPRWPRFLRAAGRAPPSRRRGRRGAGPRSPGRAPAPAAAGRSWWRPPARTGRRQCAGRRPGRRAVRSPARPPGSRRARRGPWPAGRARAGRRRGRRGTRARGRAWWRGGRGGRGPRAVRRAPARLRRPIPPPARAGTGASAPRTSWSGRPRAAAGPASGSPIPVTAEGRSLNSASSRDEQGSLPGERLQRRVRRTASRSARRPPRCTRTRVPA